MGWMEISFKSFFFSTSRDYQQGRDSYPASWFSKKSPHFTFPAHPSTRSNAPDAHAVVSAADRRQDDDRLCGKHLREVRGRVHEEGPRGVRGHSQLEENPGTERKIAGKH